ncbi:MAG: LysM peptidoglycan-binding domain-containing protein [Christensenellaceae bacterium]|nr:LysM peptidoglycan-binding domain-containing protein [Christensenellaceae bacterium]
MERANCPSGSARHLWQPGDTLLGLATQNRTTVTAIRAANPGVDFLGIQPGTPVCVPRAVSCPSGRTYTVRPGDSIARIAQAAGTTPGELMDRNPYVDPDALTIGQVLCLPEPTPSEPTPSEPTPSEPTQPEPTPPQPPRPTPQPPRPTPQPPRPTPQPPRPTPQPPRPTPQPPRPTPQPPRPAPSPACPPGYTQRTVSFGQGLADILVRYDLSFEAFRRANPNLTPTRLIPGQRFCVPPRAQRGLCGSGRTYVIRPGEGLNALARRLDITVLRLLTLNQNMAPGDFVPGRAICIP